MRHPGIDHHPDFPFRPGREEELARTAGAFLDAPESGSLHARLLEEFVAAAHRFAFLERLVQGDIFFEQPVHPDIVTGERRSPEETGERLAREEGELLGCPDGPTGELGTILDAVGIKVLSVTFGGEAPSARGGPAAGAEPPGDLFGAFSFEGAVGPAILVGAPLGAREAAFILAHEYAHFVADVDPYLSRFCRWDPATLRNRRDTPEERRADRFARAMLMPAAAVRVAAAGMTPAERPRAGADPRWEQLAVVFEAPRAAVEARLADLELPRFGRRPASRTRGALEGPSERSPSVDLPERFINLVLASYAHGILDEAQLARFLGTTMDEARRMAVWSRVEERRAISLRQRAFEDAEDEMETAPDPPGPGGGALDDRPGRRRRP